MKRVNSIPGEGREANSITSLQFRTRLTKTFTKVTMKCIFRASASSLYFLTLLLHLVQVVKTYIPHDTNRERTSNFRSNVWQHLLVQHAAQRTLVQHTEQRLLSQHALQRSLVQHSHDRHRLCRSQRRGSAFPGSIGATAQGSCPVHRRLTP